MKGIIKEISLIGIHLHDEEDTILQKQFLVYQAILMSLGGIVWGVMAVVYDRLWQSFIPFGYVVLTMLNLIYFKETRNFGVTKTIQTAISLLLPFLFQWSLGGFIASGAVMLWALLSLVISVIYQSTRTIALWLGLFILLTLFSAFCDSWFVERMGSQDVNASSVIFLVLNIVVISSIILWLFNFMVRGKNEAFQKLKEAQRGLIHSEKMASLGELTAGIAHEIQNPLNFVNNFSEVNKELIDEMGEELENGNLDEAKVLARNIRENEEKIMHHGKRADAIVKGMLQHSRSSSGTKEPTDINALADEYLRLAYHGLRAKDKSFKADFKTDLDPYLPPLNVVPQDIGRVLLNLINNAFQASSDHSEKPLVTVTTRLKGDKAEITVTDNGPGIPAEIKDKIFQPFFTTKPTGQGTGLGLSLSYDIVKAHGGEVIVETKEEEGSIFKIHIPINNE